MTEQAALRAAALEQRVRDVVGAVLGIDPSSVRPDDSPATIAEWDSVRHLQLIVALEEEFGVQFDADEFASLTSIAVIRDRLSQSVDG